jgi:REP element-mobilizing transposase RayT
MVKRAQERKSIRLKHYDYSEPGYYFVTVCTKENKLLFNNDIIRKAAIESWLEVPHHFKNIRLDAYVFMPNHAHGIIIIGCRGAPWRVRAANEM